MNKITDKMLNPQSAIAGVLGSICKKPELLIDNNVRLEKDDFIHLKARYTVIKEVAVSI